MKTRFRRNHIYVVNTSEGRIEDVGGIKKEVRNFLKSNFQENNWVRPILGDVEFVSLSYVDSKSLEETFSEVEIKATVWSCNGDKSHGPGGFSFSFLQDCWELVKEDVICFVVEFYDNPSITKVVTASFITFVPKIRNPQLLSNYRPICLVSCEILALKHRCQD
ncbi:uncharacterized protein LOC127129910 [Lathyrus oleraceus]|uniref:uncharacterized protein LOC127129910 n=1 Tax=Pisum sativum TaxID=3888 RepID=UPI0021D19260|nr:uncharacterized protein LOC127129910 [Pisum sativum]